jgi:D-tyrosyl-tRNA(Tyr) deacylase
VRAVVQRVRKASVSVEDADVAAIAHGLVVLVGIERGDNEEAAAHLAGKIARLRVFENDDGRFDRSLLDVGGEALVVSQITLLADSRREKGTRPDFSKAARPEVAEPLYGRFVEALRAGAYQFRRACSALEWSSRSSTTDPSRSSSTCSCASTSAGRRLISSSSTASS